MAGTGFNMQRLDSGRKNSDSGQALLFIAPSIVVTVISILMFTQLTGFTVRQTNDFSIAIMAAIVFSLAGTAWMQVIIYRIMDDREHFKESPALRGIKAGILYSVLYSAAMSALVSLYLVFGLQFSVLYCAYFALILVMYSITWVVTAAFWAAGEYRQPAAIFTLSYIALFILTYIAHKLNPEYTIAGYTIGVTVLFLVSCIAASRSFRYPLAVPGLRQDIPAVRRLASKNGAAIAFSTLYVVALFLDKIIVWVSQGIATGEGLLVTGPYTAGAFLGLIPMFAVAAVAYFTSRSRHLVEERYLGTLKEIEARARQYKRLYWSSLGTMVGIAIGLFILTAAAAYFLIGDAQVMRILVTTGLGGIFFLGIMHNSAVLPLFGRSSVSAVAVLAVCLGELAAVPFVAGDVWSAALGFTAGSFVGCLISCISINRLFADFEYNIFRYVSSGA